LTDTSVTLSNTDRCRPFVVFAAASLVAVGSGAAALALTGASTGSWLRNPVAWLVGLVSAAGLMFLRNALGFSRTIMAVAVVAIACSFLAPAQDGVHRWIDVGPLHVNVAALLLPSAVLALAFCRVWSRSGAAFAAVTAALLVLQPDASQATSFLVAVIILLARSGAPRTPRFAAMGVALLAAAASWARPDPLQPVPEVEGIFPLAFAASPVLAAFAALALAAASFAPLAIRASAGSAHWTAALALTGYFVSAAICPAFGAFPVPLVGLGMSFPVGYWLGIALLCGNGSRQRDAALT
jgi:hypothetical protein